MAITIVVPGPLHPDLFGGMTPIMTPVTVRAFEVEAEWTERHGKCVTLLAVDEHEAEAIAEHSIGKNRSADLEDFTARVDEIDAESWRIDESDIAAYRKLMGEINAKSVCTVTGRAR